MARTAIPVTEWKMVAATLTTAETGTDNDLTFTALNPGPEGNDIEIQYLEPGGDNALSVEVVDQTIVVSLATTGGASTSTATDVLTAVNAHAIAREMVFVELAASNDGSGLITAAMAATNLAGGTFGPAQPSQTAADVANGNVIASNLGRTLLEVSNEDAAPQTVTFPAPAALVSAGRATDRVETVAAGATRLFGPFPTWMNQTGILGGDLYVDASDANVEFRAYLVLPIT